MRVQKKKKIQKDKNRIYCTSVEGISMIVYMFFISLHKDG